MKKIHLNDEVWEYKVGKSNLVVQAPNGAKKVVSFEDLIRVVNPDFLPKYLAAVSGEDELDFAVEPKDVKQYIEEKGSTFIAPVKRTARKGLTASPPARVAKRLTRPRR